MADHLCFHIPQAGLPLPSSVFVKKTFKEMSGGKLKHIQPPQDCLLCVAYGVRVKLLTQGDRAPKTLAEVDIERVKAGLNGEAFDSGYNDLIISDERPSTPLNGLTRYQFSPFVFPIVGGQNGEPYHAMICALLTNNNKDVEKISIQVPLDPKKDKTPKQRALLAYYVNGSIIADNQKGDSKDRATRCIATAFDKISGIGFMYRITQEEIFSALRVYLDDRWLVSEVKTEYACSSYLGKYWINRYLTITDQPSRKLPKAGINVKIAVIILRVSPEADDGRLMVPENLNTCLEAIRLTNQIAVGASEKPFTHVLLLNDIEPTAVPEIRDRLQKDRRARMQLLYLSTPFQSLANRANPTETERRIDGFWQGFKGDAGSLFQNKPEGAPNEVKYFAFFLALQKRYGDQLCYIGFRSGTLDGPGFIGSPIFYLDDTGLNNVTTEKDPGFAKFADLRYLIDAFSDGAKIEERMNYASQALNTFVRINVLQKTRTERVGHGKVAKGKDVIVLDKTARNHLAAALYVYMISQVGGQPPLWTNRVAMMKTQIDRDLWLEPRLKDFLGELNKSGE